MLQKNKIYLGDCLEVMKDIEDGSIDMILCDMPYGTTKCRWDSLIPLNQLWQHYERIIKRNGAIVLFAQTPFDKVLGSSKLDLLRYEWIWEKTTATGHLNAKKMPMKAHENILVFYKEIPKYNPQKTCGHKPVNSFTKYINTQNRTEVYGECSKEIKGGGNTDRYPRSIQVFSTDKQKYKFHSTQKPIKLCEYLIKTYTSEGDLVLDNCIGSGTTAVACINTNRSYLGIEKNEQIFNTAVNRIKAAKQPKD